MKKIEAYSVLLHRSDYWENNRARYRSGYIRTDFLTGSTIVARSLNVSGPLTLILSISLFQAVRLADKARDLYFLK